MYAVLRIHTVDINRFSPDFNLVTLSHAGQYFRIKHARALSLWRMCDHIVAKWRAPSVRRGEMVSIPLGTQKSDNHIYCGVKDTHRITVRVREHIG